MTTYDIIIIGAGASGVMAALSAAQYNKKILLIDGNDCICKKITATGNGKCNYTNRIIRAKDYYEPDADFFNSFMRISSEDLTDIFEAMGMPSFEKNGYCYPYSNQASSVQKVFERELASKDNIRIVLSEKAESITTDNNRYCINNRYLAENLIIASGGKAAKCFGTDGDGYQFAKRLGHSTKAVYPSLCGLATNLKCLKTLFGVRHEAMVGLYVNDTEEYKEYGEMIFNKTGISGIPVMNMSGIASAAIDEGKRVDIRLDFYPKKNEQQLEDMIKHTLMHGSTIEESLAGVVNNKLAYVCLIKAGFTADETYGKNTDKKLELLCHLLKCFTVPVTSDNGFDNAQVTKGGVSLSEICPDSFRSKINNNLYFCGEILDICGKCGGYNLHFAFTSGLIAGACAAGGTFDKDKFIKAQN